MVHLKVAICRELVALFREKLRFAFTIFTTINLVWLICNLETICPTLRFLWPKVGFVTIGASASVGPWGNLNGQEKSPERGTA